MKLIAVFLLILCSCSNIDNVTLVNTPILPTVPAPEAPPKLGPIKVVVIDTGFDSQYNSLVPLCAGEHKDFTGEGLQDHHGHGTNVVGLIVENARSNSNYCIVVVKYYIENDFQNVERFKDSLQYALDIKADIVNISGGGFDSTTEERAVVLELLTANVTIIAAAGNESRDLDASCHYFPACYDSRIIVVGANNLSYSNYGSIVDETVPGKNKEAFGITMSGTSQSTAIFTGRVLKKIANNTEEL